MSEPKLHHTLPRRYQNGFSTDPSGAIWVFDRRLQRMREGFPATTAAQNEFYRWEGLQQNEANSLEKFLAQEVESPFWPVLDRLDNKESPDNNGRSRLAYFCAFLLTRVPAFRLFVQQAFASAIARYPKLAEDIDKLDALFDVSPQGLLIPSSTKNFTLKKAIDIASEAGKYLLTLDTFFMSSDPQEPFITTDVPFGLVRMLDYGQRSAVMIPGFLKWIPLSAKTAVGFGEPGDNISWTHMSPDKTRRSNRSLAVAANRLVIASTETQLTDIVRGLPPDRPQVTSFPPEID